MQLKGIVRFFTILLILYSLYMLSFSWVVNNHEKKQMERAKREANVRMGGVPDAQREAFINTRYTRLLDSTGDAVVHYGAAGAISYKEARKNELNLGLDLQGGMNVTLEVEMSGLLRSLANGSADPAFNKALAEATRRKANSDADYVTLFGEEWAKASNGAPLAHIFALPGQDRIKANDNNTAVLSAIRKESNDAFDRTFEVLTSRIDQFGVSQSTINPDKERGIITVELPGVKDVDRVRSLLQSAANLQFWKTYMWGDPGIANSVGALNDAYLTTFGGIKTDTLGKRDTTPEGRKREAEASIFKYLSPNIDRQNNFDPKSPVIGYVAVRDTALLRGFLNHPNLRAALKPDLAFAYGKPFKDEKGRKSEAVPLYMLMTGGATKPPLEGEGIADAQQSYEQGTLKPNVSIQMKPEGAIAWERLTGETLTDKRPIAIVLDGVVYSSPVASSRLSYNSEISGNFDLEEAQDLASILRAGKLEATPKIVQDQVVGPTLGRDALRGGIMSFVISFIVIFVLMLIYYNTSGVVANIALVLNLLFTIGILIAAGFTLTAPGIAGLVLTIGMAVDTNVLIYERIKEELSRGKSYQTAINDGYHRSLPPVLDGHFTVLLTAGILFYFGLGPVKGFATTQIIGILLSLFCGILVSRWITEWFTSKSKHLEYFTPLSRKVFANANFKFIEKRKIAYAISGLVLLAGIGAVINGFDYGVEFKGGRSYTVRFDKAPNVEAVRTDLTAAFGANPVIKTIGKSNQLDITTAYEIDNTSTAADSLVRTKLVEGLRNHLPAGTDVNGFQQRHFLSSSKVLPTISDDLKNGAIKATVVSLLAISLFIFLRFRDWRYSVGTLASLLHDVLVTLAVFSFARSIVPFPLEIDQHFIAAVLTVIGFSMNDTVVIFDRIREYSRQMVGQKREVIVNKAINDTMSRTIMTSLTVFLTILILFIFGGEVTRGFAFAMLIGVLVGIYSSVFVAAPVLVDLGGDRPLGGDSPTTPVVEKGTSTSRKAVTEGSVK